MIRARLPRLSLMWLSLLYLSGLLLLSSCASIFTTSFLDQAGFSPYSKYQRFETEHFEVTFVEGYEEFAKKSAQYLEQAHSLLSPLLKWTPRSKIHVTVIDNDDSANGFAAPPLRIGMVLNATPPEAWFSTAYSDDWIKLLTFHEYVHILNIDPTTEWMEWVRILYGDVVRPNSLWPSWMIEGLAVYYETRMSRRGRGRSPYYDGLIRAFIEEKKFNVARDGGITLDRMNGPFPQFPGGEIPYLFGYEMWQQLATEIQPWSKAEERFGELSLQSSSRIPYFINGNLENVAGWSWDDTWNKWVKRTESRLGQQLDRIQKTGVTSFETVTQANYSALGATVSPDGKWLAYTRSRDTTARRSGLYLKDLKTGEEKRISDKVQGVSHAFTPDSRHVIWSSVNRYRTFQMFSDLWITDLQSFESVQLTEGARAKDPTLDASGNQIVFIKVVSGTHQLWQATFKNGSRSHLKSATPVYLPPAFTILGTPRFLADGRVVFSEQKLGESKSDLKILDLQKNEFEVLLADGHMNRSPAVTPQGGVIFVSDRTGVDQLFEIAVISTKSGTRSLNQISNVTTGLQLPHVASDGTVWVSRLSSQGYQIGKLAAKWGNSGIPSPQLEPDAPPVFSPALEDSSHLLESKSPTTEYSPWSSLAPRQWAPLAGFGYSNLYGAMLYSSLAGFDSTGVHQYFGLLGYQFKAKNFDPLISYSYYGLRPRITLTLNSSTFDYGFDTAGASNITYKRTQNIEVAFDYPIRGTFDSWNPILYFGQEWNGVYDLDSGARTSSTDIDYNRSAIPSVGAALRYQDVEQSRLAFMPESGHEWSVQGEGRKYDRDYALWKYLLSYRRFIPVSEHSVLSPRARWLGSSRTLSTADRFYALGRGRQSSNISDRGTGASLEALGLRGYLMDGRYRNRSIGVLSVDYSFGLLQVFRGISTLPLFLEQSFGFLFVDGAMIENVFRGRQFLPSFGGGLTVDTTLLLQAPIRLNVEYQQGTRTDLGGEQNIVVSVQSSLL
jgi:Tol biopolymer transport system component